jgi:hypothetical protein
MGFVLIIAVLAVSGWVGCPSDAGNRPVARLLRRPPRLVRAVVGLVKPRQVPSGYG